MKKSVKIKLNILFLITFVFILFSIAVVISENNSASFGGEVSQSDSSVAVIDETTSAPISEEKVELTADPGITPDNPVYFIKDIYQRMTVGDNLEKALNYKEQKIAEAEAMVEKGKPEQAEEVLDRALQYAEIIEREASPEMKDQVQESSAAVENAIKDMEEKTTGNEWENVRDKFEKTIEKEKEIGTATELAAKINELCASLAKLDTLQYADTCKPKDNSPKWMKKQDKQLTVEQEKQAKVFFEKLSQCFENPKDCDCTGMGVQKFEDFCLEKSKLTIECEQGNEDACKEAQFGSDPIDLLPDYLVPVLNQVQGKYMKAQYNMYTPEECTKHGAITPEDCNKIMFQISAPKECIDAGLTGKSMEDNINCKQIMYQQNTPQECIDVGISTSDANAPRKCAKLIFQTRAPQACLDIGITGERTDDEIKCKELTQGKMIGTEYKPTFNKDCNSISDINEKIKCYEEFYNNAQVQIRDDFRQREINQIQIKEQYMRCQSQQQIEIMRQDCLSRGEDARIEYRAGCPWVVCSGQLQQDITQQSGMKCPDEVCDEYEKMNPYACPEDCGGTKPFQPCTGVNCPVSQTPCQGSPPICGSGSYFVCQNGNWICISTPSITCPGSSYSCPSGGYSICQNGEWTCAPITITSCSGSSYACGGGRYSYCQNGVWVCPPMTTCTGTPQSCSNGEAYCRDGKWVCPPTTTMSCPRISINCPVGTAYCDNGAWKCPSSTSCSGTSVACSGASYSVCENGAWICRPITRTCTETAPNCPIGIAYCSDGNWMCPSQSPNCPGMSIPCNYGSSSCQNGNWMCPSSTSCSGSPYPCPLGGMSYCNYGAWVCPITPVTQTCTGSGPSCSSGSPICQNGNWVCPSTSPSCSGYAYSCGSSGMAVCQNGAWTCPTTTTTGCSGLMPTCAGGISATCQNNAWTCATTTTIGGCSGSGPSCSSGSPICQNGNWMCPSTSPYCSGYAYSCGSSGMAVCQNGAWTCPTTTTTPCTGSPSSCSSGGMATCQNGAWYCPPTSPLTCSGSGPSCSSGSPACQNGVWVCPATGGCTGSGPSCSSGSPYCQDNVWMCPSSPTTPPPSTTPPPESPPVTTPPPESPPVTTPPPESPPVTGGVITGRVITSTFGDENTRSGDAFLDYWFQR